MTDAQKYYGKYHGTVINNIDPMKMCRIQTMVPEVSDLCTTGWAMPCLRVGIFAVHVVGSSVWIEFEQGNPDYPIWTGCYWGSANEVPQMEQIIPPLIQSITIQTSLQNGIMVSDAPGATGGILIRTRTGARISVNDLGIVIQNGKGAVISMMGSVVDIKHRSVYRRLEAKSCQDLSFT